MHLPEFMARNGISRAVMAAKLGVSAEAVRRYEMGERTPRPDMLRRIVRVTGGEVTPDDMIGPRPVASSARTLVAKIANLPLHRLAEIEDFVDFIAARENERELIAAASAGSAPAFAAAWDNPDDAAYDGL